MQIIRIPPIKQAVDLAIATMNKNRLIVYPTDTVYGIGGDGREKNVVERIAKIKNREDMTFSIIVSDWKMAREYGKIKSNLEKKLEEITPGPFAFLIKKKLNLPVSNNELIGIRIPDNEFCIKLAEGFGGPIVSTSANLHGKSSISDISLLDEKIANNVDLIVDGGPCKYKEGSTIIDLSTNSIVRKGAGLEIAEKWLKTL